MTTPIGYSRFTYFPTKAVAEAIAEANQADDDSAEYRVESAELGFFVAIYEDGERLGTL